MSDFTKGEKGCLVDWDDDGNVEIEGMNFKTQDGSVCEQLADDIVADIGGEMTSREYKPEFNRNNQRQGQKQTVGS